MRISGTAWDFKDENFGPLLPFVKDDHITDINYNGTDVWVEDLQKGVYRTDVALTVQRSGVQSGKRADKQI